MKYKCLSIAGFDPSGGAGLQADLKAFSAFGCYGMTVLTALTVQNTKGVKNCYSLPLKSIQEQLEHLFEDIVPDSIKIGMLFSKEVIQVVSDFLKNFASNIPIVLDPVMVAKSGDSLLKPEAIEALKTLLIPKATLLTPNWPESISLTENKNSLNDTFQNQLKKNPLEKSPLDQKNSIDQIVEERASKLLNRGAQAVLIKGGHWNKKEHQETLKKHSNDFYLDQKGKKLWFKAERIDSKNTHGTGCTFSSAIASCLALKMDLIESIQYAKKYITQAIQAAQNHPIGYGNGPVHHFYHLWPSKNKIFKPSQSTPL